jgi:hypothetical protein
MEGLPIARRSSASIVRRSDGADYSRDIDGDEKIRALGIIDGGGRLTVQVDPDRWRGAMPRPVILGTLVGLCLTIAGARGRTSAAHVRGGKAKKARTVEVKAAVITIDDYVPIVRNDGSQQWVFKSRALHPMAQGEAPRALDGGEVPSRTWSIANPN